jgi:DNA-binding response OmpR family regulator
VEDDISLNKALISFFNLKQYEIESYFDGEEAFNHLALSNLADIYIIDINLPGINGLDLIKQIRKIDAVVPIVVITASVEISTLEEAYDFGCSEYIKKPFNLRELEIRIERLCEISLDKIIKVHCVEDNSTIEFDLKNNVLHHNGNLVELQKKELRFLTILFKNYKFIVKTSDIEDYVWEGEIKDIYPLRQLVTKLRKKLPCNFVKTEVGIGYYIADEN